MQAIKANVVVRKDADLSVSLGGIHLIAGSEQPMMTGTVVSVGSGRVRDKGYSDHVYVNDGDRVAFSKYAKEHAKYRDGDTLIIQQMDIIAVIDGDKLAPIRDVVLIKKDNKKLVDSIVYMPTEKDREIESGIVFAVGGGKVINGVKHSVSVKEGDRVFFFKEAHEKMQHGWEDIVAINESDILGIAE